MNPKTKMTVPDIYSEPVGEKRKAALETLCRSLGIQMRNYRLLDIALTHSSYAHERHQTHLHYNERLEFLGDSVLSLIVSTYIFRNYRHFNEGRLTKLRAQVVCEASLYLLAKQIHLGDYLLMGRGEEHGGGQYRPSILADAFEAVLGAYYLDQGLAAAETYLLGLMEQEIIDVCNGKLMVGDYKTMLQEHVQKQSGEDGVRCELLGYEGPEHNRVFESGVYIEGTLMGKGKGRTKKESEQHAAQEALEMFRTGNSGKQAE